jgi:hypothetical protein
MARETDEQNHGTVVRLEAPITIAQVAKMAGWPTWRMKQHLLALDRELGGTLLLKSAGRNRRYTLTLASLKRVCPDLFEDSRNFAVELDSIREDLDRLSESMEIVVDRLSAMSKRNRIE